MDKINYQKIKDKKSSGSENLKILKQIIKDHIEYRKQIFKLAKADLLKTYRGSALRMVMGNY